MIQTVVCVGELSARRPFDVGADDAEDRHVDVRRQQRAVPAAGIDAEEALAHAGASGNAHALASNSAVLLVWNCCFASICLMYDLFAVALFDDLGIEMFIELVK